MQHSLRPSAAFFRYKLVQERDILLLAERFSVFLKTSELRELLVEYK